MKICVYYFSMEKSFSLENMFHNEIIKIQNCNENKY